MEITAMQAIVSALPGRVGLYVHDLNTGEKLTYKAELPVNAASVIKLSIMAEAFRQREAGLADFAEEFTIREEDKKPSCGALTYMHTGLTVQLGDLVSLMIIVSDNTATNLLIDRLGIENINRMIGSLGLTGTRLQRKLWQPELSAQGIQNYVTALDCGRLMELLLAGQVVSPRASEEMLAILLNQRLNGKMPFLLHDKGIRCAHKTGEDDGVTHDVGVIYADHTVVFCFVSEKTDVPRAERALQELAGLAAGL